MRYSTKNRIKEIVKGKETPIVSILESPEKIQDLKLFQFTELTFMAGRTIPKDTYLLTTQQKFDELSIMGTEIRDLEMDSITAFVLPYVEGGTGKVTLDDTTDMVVTARLTGCTVAADLNTDTPTLLHLNHRKETSVHSPIDHSAIDDAAIDDEIREAMGDKNIFTVTKHDYTLTTEDDYLYAATFMGFKEEDQWSYFTQIIRTDCNSDDYELIKGNRLTVIPSALGAMSFLQSIGPAPSSEPAPTESHRNDAESDRREAEWVCSTM